MVELSGPASNTPEERQPARFSLGFLVGLVVVVAVTGYIITSSMGSTVHYHEVSEVAAEPDLIGSTMRLRGAVVDGSHRVRTGTLDEHLFLLASEGSTITVLYQGAVPDQFEDGADVIATGVLVDAETFEADSLTTQCPSRYEAETPTSGDGVNTRRPNESN